MASNNKSNGNNWSDEIASYHHNHQPSTRHQHRGQMSDYREKIPPNEEEEGVVPYETEQIVDSEWEDFEKLLRSVSVSIPLFLLLLLLLLPFYA